LPCADELDLAAGILATEASARDQPAGQFDTVAVKDIIMVEPQLRRPPGEGRKRERDFACAVLNGIADTLVLEAKFASKEDALRSLARAAVRERMVRYRRRIQRMERKHGTDFDGFTRIISGSAMPQ
jgi:hypothetical protein